jgi:Zn-dependent peptidase ImmA (M78 family)
MDYRGIKVPYINNADISRKAERYRRTYWDDSVPVEIEDIIEFKLKIYITTIKGLVSKCDIDALIRSDWKEIFIDYDRFLDERQKNRLRFSLAHEIGHYVLHQELYKSFDISSVDDFKNFYDRILPEQYGYIETQANKFANYLLVPRQVLRLEADKALKTAVKDFNLNIREIDKNTLYAYLAVPLAEIFGVSDDVIQIALSGKD